MEAYRSKEALTRKPIAYVSAALLFFLLTACGHQRDRLSAFDYVHRPSGYNWTPRRDNADNIVYYGKDPATGWTVYVGVDGAYYSFPHNGDITPHDLNSSWNPHDVEAPSAR